MFPSTGISTEKYFLCIQKLISVADKYLKIKSSLARKADASQHTIQNNPITLQICQHEKKYKTVETYCQFRKQYMRKMNTRMENNGFLTDNNGSIVIFRKLINDSRY